MRLTSATLPASSILTLVLVSCGAGQGPTQTAVEAGTPALTFPCIGGVESYQQDGGVATLDAAPVDSIVTCVVGESYCSIESFESMANTPPARSCESLTGPLAACAATPTCACICANGVACATNCACTDTGGFLTVSCDQT